MMKHARCVSNLANEDVDLVGMFDQTWSCFCGRATLMTFKFACDSICSLGETSEKESFFGGFVRCILSPCLRSNFGEDLSFVTCLPEERESSSMTGMTPRPRWLLFHFRKEISLLNWRHHNQVSCVC